MLLRVLYLCERNDSRSSDLESKSDYLRNSNPIRKVKFIYHTTAGINRSNRHLRSSIFLESLMPQWMRQRNIIVSPHGRKCLLTHIIEQKDRVPYKERQTTPLQVKIGFQLATQANCAKRKTSYAKTIPSSSPCCVPSGQFIRKRIIVVEWEIGASQSNCRMRRLGRLCIRINGTRIHKNKRKGGGKSAHYLYLPSRHGRPLMVCHPALTSSYNKRSTHTCSRAFSIAMFMLSHSNSTISALRPPSLDASSGCRQL